MAKLILGKDEAAQGGGQLCCNAHLLTKNMLIGEESKVTDR